jgi:Tfp pilus assembly protein PilX
LVKEGLMTPRNRITKVLIPIRDERGVALIIALFVGTLMLILGAHFMTASMTEKTIAANEVEAARAFYAAEAGIEHAKKTLADVSLSAVLNGTDDVFAGTGKGKGKGVGSSAVISDATYTVHALNNIAANGFPRGTVPADPSNSDTVDGDNIIVLTSTGTFRTGLQTIETVMQVNANDPFSKIPGAITMVSKGNNEFDFEDSTLTSGHDESGTCEARPAFVNRSKWLNFDEEGGKLSGALEGAPDPWRWYDSAYDDPIYDDPDALVSLVEQWMKQPGVVKIAGPFPPTQLGTADKPQVTVWNIDPKGPELVVPEGGPKITGYGILIVTGEIALEGDFEFHGLIVAKTKRQLTIGKGKGKATQVVHGAILAVDNQKPKCGSDKKCQEDEDKGKELAEDTKVDLEDEAHVYFNCDALRKYAKPIGGVPGGGGAVKVLSWRRP